MKYLNIDYALLSTQKLALIESDFGNTDAGEGLISLIDAIQDEAVKNGEPEKVVFPLREYFLADHGFIILSVLLTSYQPCFHEDEKLMFFKTMEAAQKEIQFLIDDVDEAIKKGDMQEEPYCLSDYKVIPATLYGEVITCIVDGISYSMLRTDDDFVPTTEFVL